MQIKFSVSKIFENFIENNNTRIINEILDNDNIEAGKPQLNEEPFSLLNSLKECLGHYMNEVHIIMEPTVMHYDSLKIGLVSPMASANLRRAPSSIWYSTGSDSTPIASFISCVITESATSSLPLTFMNYFIGKFDFLKVYGDWQKVSRR